MYRQFAAILSIAGSVHDNTALQAMQLDLPESSEIYADSAYTNYEKETFRVVKSELQHKIAAERAKIETDFSEVSSIFYIGAYLETILKNLISNLNQFYKYEKN